MAFLSPRPSSESDADTRTLAAFGLKRK
jgi:hypothetical protein